MSEFLIDSTWSFNEELTKKVRKFDECLKEWIRKLGMEPWTVIHGESEKIPNYCKIRAFDKKRIIRFKWHYRCIHDQPLEELARQTAIHFYLSKLKLNKFTNIQVVTRESRETAAILKKLIDRNEL